MAAAAKMTGHLVVLWAAAAAAVAAQQVAAAVQVSPGQATAMTMGRSAPWDRMRYLELTCSFAPYLVS